jgi:glycosyltransferase involved in cell wall biosynthesis
MRICFYTHTALPLLGGQELVIDALARQFLRHGHEIIVLAPRHRGLRLEDDRKLPYPVVRHPRFVSKRFFVSWYRHSLLRLHRRQAFDVVHSHAIYPAGYLSGLCRDQLDCPLVITSHGEDVVAGSAFLTQPRLRRRLVSALKSADALIAISRFTEDGFRELCPQIGRRIVTLPNGVHMDEIAAPLSRPADVDPAIQPNRYLFFLGRLHPRKGVDVLLRALACIPGKGVQLVIAGDGPHRRELESLTAALSLIDRVRFLGKTQGTVKNYLLQNALCLVAPTVDWEGQGLVVLESFAAGRPVVVSDLPGFRDMVRHGETGWLVPQRSPQKLAEILAPILNGTVDLTTTGKRALEVARTFTWEAIASRHLELYEELLGTTQIARAA